MAVEDGCILAEVLAEQPGDIVGALRHYEALRIPRTTRVQMGSRERAKFNHLPSRWDRIKRDVKLAEQTRFGSGNTMAQNDWIYDYDVPKAASGGGP
jgi:salicylate hydroxylase